MGDDSKTTHQALDLTTTEAVAWCAAHPEYFVFPGRLIQDEDGGYIKRPLVVWTKRATRDPEEVRRMWNEFGGRAVVCVACDPSGIFVIDEDKDVEDPTWQTVLKMVVDRRMSRVLKSATKGRPHYVFKQPTTGDPVAEGRWEYGDIKASGMIMLSNHEPIVDSKINPAPAGLLGLLKRRPKGTRGRGIASYEALNDWLSDTPLDGTILGESAQQKFLERTIEKIEAKVDKGAHRRQAVLEGVYHAALESSAGCYPAQTAYIEIQEYYRRMRDVDESLAKRWNADRALDYDYMWATLVPEFRAGDHDEQILELQNDLAERGFADEDDDFSDLTEWLAKMDGAAISKVTRKDPVAVAPVEGIETPDPEVVGVLDRTDGRVLEETPPESPSNSHTPVSTEGVDTETGEIKEAPIPGESGSGAGIAATAKVTPLSTLKLEIPEAAYWGPHGDFIEKARPYTEVSDAGLLACALSAAGAYHSLTAHLNLGNTVHGPNIFVLCVGQSAISRKSTAWKIIESVYFPKAGPPHFRPQKFTGMASGERLMHAWDPRMTEIIDPDTLVATVIEEKAEPRALWYEPEVSSLFKRAKREGALMAETVCQLWDQSDLEHYTRTAGDSIVSSEDYRAGFIGLTTLLLVKDLVTTTDAASGFGNRFLWFFLPDTGRHRDIPQGGSVPVHLLDEYRREFNFGRVDDKDVEVTLTDDAWEMWKPVYSGLKTERGNGMVEALLGRAEPYVLRLALNYHLSTGGALIDKDGGNKVVGVKPLEAALAVWDYARASTQKIFKDSTGNQVLDEIVSTVTGNGGWMLRSDIRTPSSSTSKSIDSGVEQGVLCRGQLAKAEKGPGRMPVVIGVKKMVETGSLKGNPRDIARITWELTKV